MKKIFYLLLLTFSFSFANNPNSSDLNQNEPKVGDILLINSTSNIKYNHIDLPKLNIIAKRGHAANYKSIHGNRVVVTEIMSSKNGETEIRFENENKSLFFRYLKNIEANYYKSIDSGELSKVIF